jgi:hypothetical protein
VISCQIEITGKFLTEAIEGLKRLAGLFSPAESQPQSFHLNYPAVFRILPVTHVESANQFWHQG